MKVHKLALSRLRDLTCYLVVFIIELSVFKTDIEISFEKENDMGIDYWCKCKDCKYVDPTEKKGCKWWCDYYHIYVDPDEIQECKAYKER